MPPRRHVPAPPSHQICLPYRDKFCFKGPCSLVRWPNVSTDKHATVLQTRGILISANQGSTLLGMPLPNNALMRKTRYMFLSSKCDVISWPGMLARSFPCFTLPGTASPRQHNLIIRLGILQNPAIPGALYDSTY